MNDTPEDETKLPVADAAEAETAAKQQQEQQQMAADEPEAEEAKGEVEEHKADE